MFWTGLKCKFELRKACACIVPAKAGELQLGIADLGCQGPGDRSALIPFAALAQSIDRKEALMWEWAHGPMWPGVKFRRQMCTSPDYYFFCVGLHFSQTAHGLDRQALASLNSGWPEPRPWISRKPLSCGEVWRDEHLSWVWRCT